MENNRFADWQVDEYIKDQTFCDITDAILKTLVKKQLSVPS